jgi:hypothetical protein
LVTDAASIARQQKTLVTNADARYTTRLGEVPVVGKA